MPSLYTVNQTLASLPDGVGKEALMLIRKEIPDWESRIANEAAERLDAKETKRGGDRGSNQHGTWEAKSDFVFASSQSVRAKSNGVHRDTQRKLDRLAKDRPDLLELVKSNEMSVHAAAKAAGIVKDKSQIEIAKSAWKRMNEVERNEFLSWIDS